MLFNTLDFLVFGTIVLAVRFAVPRTWRSPWLLAASLFFYGYWDWRILLLLIFTVAVNYLAALRLETRRGDRLTLAAAVVLNLAFLGFFKYYMFTQGLLDGLFAYFDSGGPLPVLDVLLPVGISFYTFQITSYIVDVSRGETRAERSFPALLLFTTYFPQLVAGPIERAGRLLPHLKDPATPTFAEFRSGMLLAAGGIFKKVFIADNLSRFVDLVLVPGVQPPAGAYFLGACAFAVQIYADFSGYTDVARGVSRMIGIELVRNFNLPFLSSNPAEFWRRWHITLGAFLRDYVYIPLGGNRIGPLMQARNVLIVWTLGGLWHGASIGFLVWGFYCGVLVVMYGACAPWIARIAARGPLVERALMYGGRVFTFLTFAHGLLLFRVESPEHLWFVVENVVPVFGADVPWVSGALVLQVLFYASPLIMMQWLQVRRGELEIIGEWPGPVRWLVYSIGLLLFVMFGSFENPEQFFYFQF